MNDKPVPYDLEAEQAVIGSLLIDEFCIHEIADFLQPEDFYREKNAWIYEACLTLSERDETINQITVAQELQRCNKLEQVEGTAYLIHLTAITPTSVHIDSYAHIVHNLGFSRRLIQAAGQIAKIGYEARDTTEALGDAIRLLIGLGEQTKRQGLVPLAEIADAHSMVFQDWLMRGGERGISTGLKDLDRAIDGLVPGRLHLVAGRPGMGKTQLALTIGREVAKQGRHVAIFSLEQTGGSLLERLTFAEAGINRYALRGKEHPDDEEYHRLWDSYEVLSKLPIYVDDTGAILTSQVQARLMRLKLEVEVGLVIFDYIDLAGDKSDSEEKRYHSVARALKAIAQTCDVPMLALVQLNRQVEGRNPPVPKLSDLRYSGGLEAVADVVLLLYREQYYIDRKEMREEERDDPENSLRVIVAKHKEGPVGKRVLYYNASIGRIAGQA